MMTGIKQEANTHSNAMTDVTSSVSTDGQPAIVDPLDSLLDLSEYDNANNVPYTSPSMSPSTGKDAFVRPTAATTPASLLSASQPMTGPSHQYEQYKQQTGFVPGALANTFAVTQNTTQLTAYNSGIPTSMDINFLNLSGTGGDDVFDFNTAPSAHNTSTSPSDIDLEFESPEAEAAFFFPDQMVNGTPIIPGQEALPSSPGSIGRLWPGMHQRAALAKAQHRQQQQITQQQQHQRHSSSGSVPPVPSKAQGQQAPMQRSKPNQATDPIIEQKISQLLNTMRASQASGEGANGSASSSLARFKKDEEDMDEDERLLASEEGKKLSSKERRQLRNKVSARAFRSRRKEYISQLESEIASKVAENGDLRAQNRALAEENKRLSDLTRMLLGSPSFSDFLDRLSTNPALLPPNQAQPQAQAQPQPAPTPAAERQAPRDVNPTQQQQIGMAMIPEANLDFSMLQMDTEPVFTLQPQVYAVFDTPHVLVPAIDASILSGKASNFVGSSCDEEEKIDMPVIEHPISVESKTQVPVPQPAAVDPDFANNPLFALYHDNDVDANISAPACSAKSLEASCSSAKPRGFNAEVLADVDVNIRCGVATEKALARYEVVDSSEEAVSKAEESISLWRIARVARSIKASLARLDMLNAER